jgi:hypothetical protein
MECRMENKPVNLFPGSQWEVLFEDTGRWRMGLYRPDALSCEGVETLEKHSCPELFICAGGRAGLVLFDGEREHCVDFQPHEAMMVSQHHNGYRIDAGAFFYVVERSSFSTEYIDRKTWKYIRRVET